MQTVLETLFSVGFAVSAALVISGAITWIAPAWHGALQRIVTLAWLVTALIVLVSFIAIAVAPRVGNLPTTLGYTIVVALILPLLGIARLGAPPEPGEKRDPDAPVLSPRQAAQVDGVAAIVVGLTYAVIVWRLTDVMALAA